MRNSLQRNGTWVTVDPDLNDSSMIEASVVSLRFIEEQPQILRLTTPKLRSVWGPFRSG